MEIQLENYNIVSEWKSGINRYGEKTHYVMYVLEGKE